MTMTIPGLTPPGGWAGLSVASAAHEKLAHRFVPVRSAPSDKTSEFLWRYTKRLNGGKNLAPQVQETGDCVSFAMAQAGRYLTAVSICEHGENHAFKEWFPPFIYGVSRTAPECGAGQLGHSAGSVGAWAAEGARLYGVLFSDDPHVPAYSGELADRWGYRGVPAEYYQLAKDNPLKSYSLIESVDELRAALLNKCPVIIGSQWGFETKTRGGRLIYTPSGSWGHEMCFIGWQDDPFPAAFRLNSWPDHGTKNSPYGEPDGGAWCPAEYLEKEIRESELIALNAFAADETPGRYAFV